MSEDLNLHVETMRALFKKRFSGGYAYFDGSKSPDIFKGRDDININEVDWSDEIIGSNFHKKFFENTKPFFSKKNYSRQKKIIENLSF